MRGAVSNNASCDRSIDLVLDTSAAINLICTARSRDIIAALDRPVRLPSRVHAELRDGRACGHDQIDAVEKLLGEGILEAAPLDDASAQTFLTLVGGPSTESLGDGEAATIAIAHATQAVAVIDERKARRIIRESYATLSTVMTVDLLLDGAMIERLGAGLIADATLAAIRIGRMSIRIEHYDWLASRVDRAALDACSSVRRLLRRRSVPR